jgi:hypothetical protein
MLKQKENTSHQQTNNTHEANPATTKSTWCSPSERHPTSSLLLRRLRCLYGDTRVRRSKSEFSQAVSMGNAIGKLFAIITTQAHSTYDSIDLRYSYWSLNSLASGAPPLHTLQQEKPSNKAHATTHFPISATTKSTWCSPSERHPTPLLLHRRFHCLQTSPSGEHMRREKNRCKEV